MSSLPIGGQKEMARQGGIRASVALLVALCGVGPVRALDEAQYAREVEAAYKAGDVSRATELLKAWAATGSPRAQYNLGVNYERGIGVEQDPKQAFTWTQKAAEGGYAQAQVNLAAYY